MANFLQFSAGTILVLLPVTWVLVIITQDPAESIGEFVFMWACYLVTSLLVILSIALGVTLLQGGLNG